MLRVQPVQMSSTHFEQMGEHPIFATLDVVPPFALTTLSNLYNYLIRSFEKCYGVVIHGPIDSSEEARRDWGRSVQLPSGEMLQLKFAPVNMLQDSYDGIAMISVKLTSSRGSSVRTSILFPPEPNVAPSNTLMTQMCDHLGPRGMHLLTISFFKHHNPMANERDMDLAENWTTDKHGYGSARSTTFSVSNLVPKTSATNSKKPRRGESAAPFDHALSNVVAPGTSVFVVAGQLVDCHLPTTYSRSCEPIHMKDFENVTKCAINGICMGDVEVGKSAIAASISICELLSGEGLLSMASHPYFKTALPSKLMSPMGTGLIICFAVRIAMTPRAHGQPCGPMQDQIAAAELKSIFESQIPYIPILKRTWALDIVISVAKAQAGAMMAAKPNDDGLATRINDGLVYWHRLGQSIISSVFGIGTSMDHQAATRFGPPWRFHDPLISAKDAKAVSMGMNLHSIRKPPRIEFSSSSQRRTNLVKLLKSTEEYLRTGVFDGKRLGPENDKSSGKNYVMSSSTMNELFFPSVRDQIQRGEVVDVPTQQEWNERLLKHYNVAATGQAVIDLTEALHAGPVVHYKHNIGTHLVSETQVSPCCDCDQPVHVLSGIMLSNAFGECPNCSAKRCLSCLANYSVEDMMKKNKKVDRTRNPFTFYYGAQCTRCGFNPNIDASSDTTPSSA